jgi:hypothetical protein
MTERNDKTSLASLLSAGRIVLMQDEATALWHQETVENPVEAQPATCPAEDFLALVRRQHASNFLLWHTEDEARRPGATNADLARVKRTIDSTNQLRNDLAEQCDQFLLDQLGEQLREAAELHSETPGMMMDRLSILALRIFHTKEEIKRTDAPPGHWERNQQRLEILRIQRTDLSHCLDRLWQQILAGERRFKLYRQLKMYNDPTLNPSVYGAKKQG